MGTKKPGESIGKRYRILDTLGQGGMGTVLLAKDRLAGLVALKRLGTGAEPEPEESEPLIGGPGSFRTTVPIADPAPSSRQPAPPSISPDEATRISSAPVEPVPLPPASLASTMLHVAGASSAAPALRRAPLPDRSPESSVLLRTAGLPGDDLAEILRLTLAREFHLLASLRHPNIISVLDYGFDDDLSPYFTMELLQGAESIMTAAAGRTLEDRLDLIAQTLQALAYLHRRGVIHRDLKPGNVMVVGGQVKVLDFGVSTLRERRATRRGVIVGTLAYMAPEVLTGGDAAEASDLYALGTIVYEIFAGKHPFDLGDVFRLREEILRRPPDLTPIDPRIAPVVGRLLAKRPEARYESVDEVFADLGARTGRPLLVETAATRESFLQAAELVGRDEELAQLAGMLAEAVAGRGAGALVGGESGVGKSRLLDEIRARALVDGVVVLRGQAADVGSAGGGPYHVFREVLRGMVLRVPVNDFEAGVLAAVVPDLDALIEREVPERDEIDPEAAHARLVSVVAALFERLDAPALVILEDLQWAGSESLRMLARLGEVVADLPVLVVGSYRDDERGDLPREIPRFEVLKLGRLTFEGIAALAASMLGEAGRRPEVIDRLRRETEGNPFFLVEVVRVLAEDAGALSRVGIEPMPATLPAGGLHLIVRRRLNQVPRRARPLLEAAAVIGRRLDPALLQRIDPEADVDAWIRTCANVAVIDFVDGAARFTHDKLREGLLSALSAESSRDLHRRVALAIEAEYGDAPEQTMALAHHWAMAGDAGKEAHYSALAGEQALQSSAYADAAAFFERSIALASSGAGADGERKGLVGRALRAVDRVVPLGLSAVSPDSARFRLGRWEGRLCEVYGRMSNHVEAIRHGALALAHLGLPMPEGSAGLAAGIPVQVALRGVMSVSPAPFSKVTGDAQAVLREATRIHVRISESCIFTGEPLPLVWSGLSLLNVGEPVGPTPDLARGYAVMAAVAGIVNLHAAAEAWSRRALSMVEEVGKPYDVAFVLQRVCSYRLWMGEWDVAEAGFLREIAIARQVGDQRLVSDAMSLLSFGLVYQGRYVPASAKLAELRTWMVHHPDPELVAGELVLEAWVELRRGRAFAAVALCREAQPAIDAIGVSHGIIRCYGVMALAHALAGDTARAQKALDRALPVLAASRPVAYWTFDGVAAAAEAALSVAASSGTEADAARAKKAVRAAEAYASVFPIGRPSALLWEGLLAERSGQPGKARRSFERAAAEAERLRMPFERGRAFLELGSRLRRGDPERRRLLERAEAIFFDLGAEPDRARARTELG